MHLKLQGGCSLEPNARGGGVLSGFSTFAQFFFQGLNSLSIKQATMRLSYYI